MQLKAHQTALLMLPLPPFVMAAIRESVLLALCTLPLHTSQDWSANTQVHGQG